MYINTFSYSKLINFVYILYISLHVLTWGIKNKVKVEVVDGLAPKGQAVEGYTKLAETQGKKLPKSLQNKIDKQNLKITKLQDKLTMLEGGNTSVTDEVDLVREELRIAKNELSDLQKEAKGKTIAKNITIYIDKNAPNPYATLRGELEHSRDMALGTVPKHADVAGSGEHFSRYVGDNEGEVAPNYTYKKSEGRAKALEGQQVTNNTLQNEVFSENVKQYEKEGFSYSEGISDGFGEQRYDLKDSQGNTLGFVEYTIGDNTLSIDEVMNLTKSKRNWQTGEKLPKTETDLPSTPNVAEKLIDKLISDNPNVKIQWDAVTPEGRLFKQRYLEKHPELKEKVQGISTQDELDSQLKNEYNTSKNGGVNEERNQSGFSERNRSSLGEDTLSNDSIKTESDSSQRGERISNTEGNISESNSGTNKRRNVTNTDISTNTGVEPQQLKIDFNTKAITEAATTDDIVNGVVDGAIKLDSKEAVDTFILYIPI